MSTTNVTDLWPDDIHADVLSPAMVLHAQVEALAKKSGGILRVDVRTDMNQEKIELSLDLIAPAVNDYRITLLKVWHDPDMVYPATVKSRGLLPAQARRGEMPQIPLMAYPPHESSMPDERTAETQEEFIKVISDILRSGWVRSLIQSLIARSNEALAEKSKARTGNGAHPPDKSHN